MQPRNPYDGRTDRQFSIAEVFHLHSTATCFHCDWHDTKTGDGAPAAVTAAARHHVRDTGHVVDVNTSKTFRYTPRTPHRSRT